MIYVVIACFQHAVDVRMDTIEPWELRLAIFPIIRSDLIEGVAGLPHVMKRLESELFMSGMHCKLTDLRS